MPFLLPLCLNSYESVLNFVGCTYRIFTLCHVKCSVFMICNTDCENVVIFFSQSLSLLLSNFFWKELKLSSVHLFVQHTFIEFLLCDIHYSCLNHCYVSKDYVQNLGERFLAYLLSSGRIMLESQIPNLASLKLTSVPVLYSVICSMRTCNLKLFLLRMLISL